MKQKISTQAISGFPEYLPDDQLALAKLKKTIEDVYRSFAFMPLDTPLLERREVLLSKAGGETEHQIYFLDKGEEQLALRFDLTVPLARYVSEYAKQITFPFKRYQIAKVYRGERPQRGRFREFYQADIDTVFEGVLPLSADAEIIKVIIKVFERLEVGPFTVKISNRKLLNGLLADLKLIDKGPEIMRILDRLPKVGASVVTEDLLALGVSEEAGKRILELTTIKDNVLENLEKLAINHPDFIIGLAELREVADCLADYGISSDSYAFDLSIARGLDYYTGTVFETFLNDHAELGSICSGGRYENLVSGFGDGSFPGVGASIGLSRLYYQLKESQLLADNSDAVADALVISSSRSQGEALADKLRARGLRVAGSYGPEKLKKKMALANKWRVKEVYFLEEQELAKEEVAIKDMISGEQKNYPLKDFAL